MDIIHKRHIVERSVFYLPAILFIVEASQSFIPIPGMGTLRVFAVIGIIALFYLRNIERLGSIVTVWVFLFYTFILCLATTRYAEAFQNYLRVVDSLMMLPVGYEAYRSWRDFERFLRSLIVLGIVFVINGIVCASLGIGYSPYGGKFVMGTIIINKLYSGSLFLILVPLILLYPKFKKYIISVFIISAVLYIELILMMRRTAIAIPLLGLFIYFLFSQKKRLFFIAGLALVLLLTLSFPLYKEVLLDSMANREHVFGEEAASLDEELRYIESIAVNRERLGNWVPYTNFFFGKEALNSKGNYYGGALGSRPIHVDFNKLLHGLGVVGVFLYLLIYVQVIVRFLIAYHKSSKSFYLREIRAAFWAFIIVSLVVSSIGGFYELTFRSIIFLFLGMSIKIFELDTNNEENIREYGK